MLSRSLCLILLALTTPAAQAAPHIYLLDSAQSKVGFSYEFSGAEKQGQMPVKSTDMRIDLRNISASQVSVTLNAHDAKAGFVFATEAMKGPQVLHTKQFPEITFTSTKITGTLAKAKMAGKLTIRGVTQDVTLDAGLYRQSGTKVHNQDNLIVLLTGTVNRHDFGASGFPSYVGDLITLRILAQIDKES
ncbi:YceI family protein [Roseovarius sp. EL26]|uniref:YceI family protein n=1 Tax=Roseovarius sp. EL26 TaxID=2126672 RepID=UPI0020B114B5|nr:YceI family protein [Roseovarius sp. EL26]